MGIGLLLGLMTIYLWYLYADTRPKVSNPSEGRVYSLNTHGNVVYLTLAESARLYGLLIIGGLCMTTGILIGYKVEGRI